MRLIGNYKNYLVIGWLPVAIIMVGQLGCGPEGHEPAAVEMPVYAHLAQTSCVNDKGWEVSIEKFWIAFQDLEFTAKGEFHEESGESALVAIKSWLIPTAKAHPGHAAGGDVTGSLSGEFLVDLVSSPMLGTATLLEGDYHGVNFKFRRAKADDFEEDDVMIDRMAVIVGTAKKDDVEHQFEIRIDPLEAGSEMNGGVFNLKVVEGQDNNLYLTMFLNNPFVGDEGQRTFFDGVDFAKLTDGILDTRIAGPAFSKRLAVHDYWKIQVE
ncbi:MAG: hypothetical protein BWX66_00794 [Deltaproteobacteria bacterium ADurb.Bin058]|nr:MAG: hypothetical protein BWX66_00794 [Deltaproteobacteria bacterium ADurb.Bin058]